MAFVNNKGHGFNDVASAVSFQTELLTLDSDSTTDFTLEIGNRGMPRVTVFLRQTVGAVPAQGNVEFSTADTLNKVKTFFPAGAALPTPLAVPVTQTYLLPSKFVRIRLVRSPGQATTVQAVIMVAQ